jgi:SAM-dependent methyltransferase
MSDNINNCRSKYEICNIVMQMLNKESILALYQTRLEKFRDHNAMLDASTEGVRSNILHHYLSAYYLNQYISPNKSMRVLDYGCGIGRICIPMSVKLLQVFACDINGDLIDAAREKAAGIPNIEFHKLDYSTDLAFIPDGSLDVAFTYGVFCHIDDTDLLQVWAELKKKLKQDGRIIFFEPTEQGQQSFRNEVIIRRTDAEWLQLIQNSPYTLIRKKRLHRIPSYARYLWTKFSFLPRFTLPFMRWIEAFTMNRKPENIVYSFDLYELRIK